jgi:hypothetical protein
MNATEKNEEVLDSWDLQFFLKNPTDFPGLDAAGFRINFCTFFYKLKNKQERESMIGES